VGIVKYRSLHIERAWLRVNFVPMCYMYIKGDTLRGNFIATFGCT